MHFFVAQDSILREIWSKSDTVLFIFAGAAAEFALNKAVDWLYFTGKLPADPLGRMFRTVGYALQIVFAPQEEALRAIERIRAIHGAVENKRAAHIPHWAYRDVLFMLIDYSIRSYELLERKLSEEEKMTVFSEFLRLGSHMQIQGLPQTYTEWLAMREDHLKEHLVYSAFTADLLKQYRRHLGFVRYWVLQETQKMLVPQAVKQLLKLVGPAYLRPVLHLYKLSRLLKLDRMFKATLLPPAYKKEIYALDRAA